MMLTLKDLLDHDTFLKNRPQLLQEHIEISKKRRLMLTPEISLFFETKASILWTIQEMLRVEKGGEAQAIEELETYNALLAQPGTLTATVLFGFVDPVKRAQNLHDLCGVENCFSLDINKGSILLKGVPLRSLDKKLFLKKTSSVHFIHFSWDPSLKTVIQDMVFSCQHKALSLHSCLPEELVKNLSRELQI